MYLLLSLSLSILKFLPTPELDPRDEEKIIELIEGILELLF